MTNGRSGLTEVFYSVCVFFFVGAGLSSVVTSFFVSIYYNVIIAYTLYYFFSAIQDQPPWLHCNNRWNTDSCWTIRDNNTRPLNSRSPSEEFYKYGYVRLEYTRIIVVHRCVWKASDAFRFTENPMTTV